MECKINLFVIGASKAGTTSIWHYLNNKEGVSMGHRKEPCTFSFKNWRERLISQEEEHYGVDALYRGEASPIYSQPPIFMDVAKRIYEYNPNAKIIYVLREPISRLMSVWRQTLSTGHHLLPKYVEKTDVEIGLMPKKLENAIWEYPLFVESCRYDTILKEYKRYFSNESIKVLFFDEMINNENAFWSNIAKFIGLENENKTKKIHLNTSVGKGVLRPRWLQLIGDYGGALGIGKKIPVLKRLFNSLEFGGRLNNQFVNKNELEKIRQYLGDEIGSVLNDYEEGKVYWKEWLGD